MAKAAGPFFSERASGSVGRSLTADTHRGMPIIRRRGTTAQPRSSAQLAARGRFARLTRSWRDLTSKQRAHWDLWAAANEPNEQHYYEHVRWSGANAFLALNAVLLMIDVAINPDPPEHPNRDPISNFVCGYNAIIYPKIIFNWDFRPGTHEWVLINAATHLKTHTHPDKSQYRYILKIAVAGINKLWPYPPRGQLHFLAPVADSRTGQRSQPAYATCWSDG